MNRVRTEYLGEVQFEIVATTSERGKKEPRKYRLGASHGMILFSEDGKVLWRRAGHNIDRDLIVKAIRKYTDIKPK